MQGPLTRGETGRSKMPEETGGGMSDKCEVPVFPD